MGRRGSRTAGICHVLLGVEAIPGPQIFSLALLLPSGKVGSEGQDSSLISSPSVSSHLCSTQTRQFYVSIQPPVGELMAPVFMSENEFKKEQGECSLGWTGGAQSSTVPSCWRSLPSFRQSLRTEASLRVGHIIEALEGDSARQKILGQHSSLGEIS